MSKLFVTGGTGFIGRRLLARLREGGHVVHALTRSSRIGSGVDTGTAGAIVYVPGDLLEPDSYREALQAADVVVHLAALTGKASREEHFRTNVVGTRHVVDLASEAGIQRLVFVSSIVAKLAARSRYPYAEAKARAEACLRDSGLPCTIVRPTIVVGHGSPNLESLRTLACAPVIAIFGDGDTLVQPIYVEDLVDELVECVESAAYDGQVLELGGPEILPVRELLQAIRMIERGNTGMLVRLPLGPVTAVASTLERIIDPRYLPLSAGQLSVFAYDTTAEPNPLHANRVDCLRGVREMLELSMNR